MQTNSCDGIFCIVSVRDLSFVVTVVPPKYVPPECGYLPNTIDFSSTDFFSFFVLVNHTSQIRLPPKRDIRWWKSNKIRLVVIFSAKKKSFLRVNYRQIDHDGADTSDSRRLGIFVAILSLITATRMMSPVSGSDIFWQGKSPTFTPQPQVSLTNRSLILTSSHFFKHLNQATMDTSVSDSPKRKPRKALTLAERIKVIERKEKGESTKSIAAAFGVGLTQIVNIYANKQELKEKWERGDSDKDWEKEQLKANNHSSWLT